MMLWFGEILIRGWGWVWLDYLPHSMWIIPIIMHIWVIKVNGKFKFFKHIVGYQILYILYFIFLLMVIDNFAEGLSPIHLILRRLRLPDNLAYPLYLSPIILFPVITFIYNLIVAKMENKRLTKLNKWILFFSPFIIPVISSILTILLFTFSSLFPSPSPDPIKDGLEIMYWTESGSLTFSLIAFERMYYLWIKEKWEIRSISSIFHLKNSIN